MDIKQIEKAAELIQQNLEGCLVRVKRDPDRIEIRQGPRLIATYMPSCEDRFNVVYGDPIVKIQRLAGLKWA